MRTPLFILVVLATGCGSPRGTYVTPAELAAMDNASAESSSFGAPGRNDAAPPGGQPGSGGAVPIVMPSDGKDPEQAEKKREEYEDKALKLERRRQDLDRARPSLAAKRESLMLEHESQLAGESIALAKAEHENRIAMEDLAHYVEVEQVRRLAENLLAMQGSADRLLETREELAQLEMMYGESGLGDATAEIVLNRTRRRLTRAEEGHRLREERSAELITIEIPREIEELELAVRAAEVDLQNARRKAERGLLERSAALTKLEGEQIKLDRESEDILRETERIERELARAGAGGRAPASLAMRTGATR